MPIKVEPDEARHRVIVTAPAGARWADFEVAVLAAIARTPALTDWGWIIDDQQPMDDVDVEGMSRIGERFQALARDPGRRTYTVVVTTDRFFPTWARVIDLNYGHRRHHSAPTLAAAESLLDRLEAGEALA